MSLSYWAARARDSLHTAKATFFLILAVPIAALMLAVAVPVAHSFGVALAVWLGLLLLVVVRANSWALTLRARRFTSPPSWEPDLEDRMMQRLIFVFGVMCLAIFVPTLTKPSANPWFDRGAVAVGAGMLVEAVWNFYRTAFRP